MIKMIWSRYKGELKQRAVYNTIQMGKDKGVD